MIQPVIVLALAVGLGDCAQCRTVRRSTVQIQQQTATVQAVITAQPYVVTYPAFVYAAGESQRLAALEEIAAQQVILQAQQTEILQALRNGQAAGAGGVSQSQAAAARVITGACLKCHAGPNAKGKIDLSDLGRLTVGQKLLMVDKVEANEMPPPPAPAVSDGDFATLRKWALEDRAAVRAFLKSK